MWKKPTPTKKKNMQTPHSHALPFKSLGQNTILILCFQKKSLMLTKAANIVKTVLYSSSSSSSSVYLFNAMSASWAIFMAKTIKTNTSITNKTK